MVNMEVWFPPQVDTTPLLHSHDLKECGSIAPPGHFGWFVPAALSRLEDCWTVFTRPETAARFDVDEFTLENLRNFTVDPVTESHFCEEPFCERGMYIPQWCRGNPCALLLTSYTNVTDFVKDHIDEMELYVKVAWVGSNLKYVTETLTKELLARKSDTNRYYSKHLLILYTREATVSHQTIVKTPINPFATAKFSKKM